MLSDAEISEEDCDVLRKNVKAGIQKKPTIVELEQRAKILHEDITKHRIAQELELLQKLIDRANEKGRRQELFQHLEKKKLLQQASYLSFVLQNIPQVTPEKIELESLDRNDNHMHRGMAGDERNGNKMHQCEDETTSPTKKNIPGVIPEKVGLEPLAENGVEKLSLENFSDGGPQKKRAEKKYVHNRKQRCKEATLHRKKNLLDGDQNL
uniref:Putative ovule protein n=1 Tax=Solanum chacoense TaxID=4108 RepID=A0A0V0IG78_SOLCH